jgi:peptide/nickel transport system substrate-binding protein
VSVLNQLGYRASLRTVRLWVYYSVLADPRSRVQAGFFGWLADYPAASNFINPLFTCGTHNDGEFCNHRIDAQVTQALSAEIRSPNAAAARWAAIDRNIVDQAPWVSLYNPRVLTVLAANVGNYQFHPYWELLLDQLWVR